MAISLSNTLADRAVVTYTQYMYRGRVIHAEGRYTVECKKHLMQMRVNDLQIAKNAYNVFDEINKAFDDCPGCQDEKEWAKSRWPSGAEL